VLTWWFETWNEANLSIYWKGTPQEFYKLHDYAVAGVRRALPGASHASTNSAARHGVNLQGAR
jgi:xylan 1,4-beta-xylosidase